MDYTEVRRGQPNLSESRYFPRQAASYASTRNTPLTDVIFKRCVCVDVPAYVSCTRPCAHLTIQPGVVLLWNPLSCFLLRIVLAQSLTNVVPERLLTLPSAWHNLVAVPGLLFFSAA